MTKKRPPEPNHTTETNTLFILNKKIEFYKEVIQKMTIQLEKNKQYDILGLNDITTCNEKIEEIIVKINEFENGLNCLEISKNNVGKLQVINDELSGILKNYGTYDLNDLLQVCFGNNINIDEEDLDMFQLLKQYFHPICYKVLLKTSIETSSNHTKQVIIKCSDAQNTHDKFYVKVYGIKVDIYSHIMKKGITIIGICDNIIIPLLNHNSFIRNKIRYIRENIPQTDDFDKPTFDNFLDSLTLKDYLITENNNDVYNKFIGITKQNDIFKSKTIQQMVKDFMTEELYNKRNILMRLLLHSEQLNNQYIAYLLYDTLSNENNNVVDTREQIMILDSFPSHIKKVFKQAINKTIQYTNQLTNFNVNKIPLEQQICLLKVKDAVKEKAMIKLKELKNKSDDSGSKARQYLDGLLKIPFEIYRKEPILCNMKEINELFKEMRDQMSDYGEFDIVEKDKYTSIDIMRYMDKIILEQSDSVKHNILKELKKWLSIGSKEQIIGRFREMEEVLNSNDIHIEPYIKLKKKALVEYTQKVVDEYLNTSIQNKIMQSITYKFQSLLSANDYKIVNNIDMITSKVDEVGVYMNHIKTTLDESVYGHVHAKTQIERIIGQWINGENDGYCFGFEGPPGVGKTSLAKKGLSNCLKDENGEGRPFAMIQMGGDSHGSTLHGHNYTYVGSSWGSIVQILIDTKCMNPIIFIDEVDKISQTANGKEIVGILTHLLDPAQNDCFQDKYFSGIDLDLSKALFILSYNDVTAIDRILLDRVHRIKFEPLSLSDKLVVCKQHILPEIYKKMGVQGEIIINDNELKYLIEEYTCESGVRKLKELLFEIIGDINLDILKNKKYNDLPIQITVENIKTVYLKERYGIRHTKIHPENKIGLINGLWANELGHGGILPIQTVWRPCEQFMSLRLTGLQGDVMKESMNVALTLAWKLTPQNVKNNIWEEHLKNKNNHGIHIHCPEGATPKDGPSAGTAITVVIYSLLNERKIKNNIAITGEICLNGNVTAIGGLDLKILGAIKAGVTEIIYPNENEQDYNKFIKKYGETDIIENIIFHPVSTIQEVIPIVFEPLFT